MKTIVKVMLGLILGAVVLIGGCTALIGAGANEAVKEIDKQQKANSITPAQFKGTKLGTSQKQVEKRFGPAADAQEFESEAILDEEPQNSSCIYYNRRGGELGDIYQFCFTEGKLDSKNSY